MGALEELSCLLLLRRDWLRCRAILLLKCRREFSRATHGVYIAGALDGRKLSRRVYGLVRLFRIRHLHSAKVVFVAIGDEQNLVSLMQCVQEAVLAHPPKPIELPRSARVVSIKKANPQR